MSFFATTTTFSVNFSTRNRNGGNRHRCYRHHRSSSLFRRNVVVFARERDEIVVDANDDDDAKKQSSSFPAICLWGSAATYWYLLFLSPADGLIPGAPIYAISEATKEDVLNPSVNFFFILKFMNEAGIDFLHVYDFPV